MAYWLLAIILAYLFFGISSLFDKLVLSGKPKPNSYTFYVCVFSLLSLLLIPFIKFSLPNTAGLTFAILDAIVHIAGLYIMYVAVEKFEVSRVAATIGASQPIFIFILTWLFFGAQKISVAYILAFVLLFSGSLLISIEKKPKLTGQYLRITTLSSIMFSFDYIFAKLVFLNQPFLQGIVWINIFMFFIGLVFLIRKESRKEIFAKQMVLNKKTQTFFLGSQICGGTANVLQSFAIYLAPVAFLAIMNSLKGIQYAFLFLITLFISYFYPKILKEGLSTKIILQKIISIMLIATGLILLGI